MTKRFEHPWSGQRWSTLDRIATRLVEQETIDAAELERLLTANARS